MDRYSLTHVLTHSPNHLLTHSGVKGEGKGDAEDDGYISIAPTKIQDGPLLGA